MRLRGGWSSGVGKVGERPGRRKGLLGTGYFPHLSSWPVGFAQGGAIRLTGRQTILNYLPMKPENGSGHGQGQGRQPEEVPGEGAFYHAPIMAEEVVSFLNRNPGNLILDGTLGGGGHTERLLDSGAQVVGFDRDPEALSYARMRLVDHEPNFTAIRGNFRNVGEVFEEVGIDGVDGMLLDLGGFVAPTGHAGAGVFVQQAGAAGHADEPAAGGLGAGPGERVGRGGAGADFL